MPNLKLRKGDFIDRNSLLDNFNNLINNNFFIPTFSLDKYNYGGCSLMAERAVVVRVTGVRFTPSASSFLNLGGIK